MRRIGQIIAVKPEATLEYERLHAQVWPEVLATLHVCNIRNYTIFRYEQMLFAYYEYIGEDFAADMAKVAANPKTREWWSYTDPLQEPLPGRAEGEWWLTMREVFHMD